MRLEGERRTGHLDRRVPVGEPGVRNTVAIDIRVTEMQARLRRPVELVRRDQVAQIVAAIVGEEQLAGHRVPVEADRVADPAREDLEVLTVGIQANDGAFEPARPHRCCRAPRSRRRACHPARSPHSASRDGGNRATRHRARPRRSCRPGRIGSPGSARPRTAGRLSPPGHWAPSGQSRHAARCPRCRRARCRAPRTDPDYACRHRPRGRLPRPPASGHPAPRRTPRSRTPAVDGADRAAGLRRLGQRSRSGRSAG